MNKNEISVLKFYFILFYFFIFILYLKLLIMIISMYLNERW